MNTCHWRMQCCALLLMLPLLNAAPSQAASGGPASAGVLSKVEITPISPNVGDTVTIKFMGTGVCDQETRILVSHGGVLVPASPVFAKNAPWPRVGTFVTKSGGHHWVTMAAGQSLAPSPSGGCLGVPSGATGAFNAAVISAVGVPVVQAPKPDLKLCLEPMVLDTEPPPGSTLKRDQEFTINGKCFGSARGTVHSTWKHETKADLKIIHWSDTKIVAKMTVYAKGVVEQDIAVRVSNAQGTYAVGKTSLWTGQSAGGIGFRYMPNYIAVPAHLSSKTLGGGIVATDEMAEKNAPWAEGICDATVCVMHKAHATAGVLNYPATDSFEVFHENNLKKGKIASCNLTFTNTGADLVLGIVNAKADKPVITVCSETLVLVKTTLHGAGSWGRYKLKVSVYDIED